MEKDNAKPVDYIMVILIIVGAVMLARGLSYEIPSRTFSFSQVHKYVGGDAYNGIMEASIRGGEISGAITAKAIYTVGGLIIIALGSSRIKINKKY